MKSKVLLFTGLALTGYYVFRVVRLKLALDADYAKLPPAPRAQSTLAEAVISQAQYGLAGLGALAAWKIF